MISRIVLLLCGAAVACNLSAAEPLKALMITGGCCHDYENQKGILSKGISARANVKFTVLHEGGSKRDHRVSVYEKQDWAKGYDVVVHNECFGGVTDKAFVHQIAKAHNNGVPAVVLHCSMHSYRNAETDEWRKVLGVTSMRHQHKTAVDVKKVNETHPVMKGFPSVWRTPNGELYEIEKIWPGTTPLATAYGARTKKDQLCVWVNKYGKGKTFGTTLGHHNETMEQGVYLDLITRGLLWSCDKLEEDGTPAKGYGPNLK